MGPRGSDPCSPSVPLLEAGPAGPQGGSGGHPRAAPSSHGAAGPPRGCCDPTRRLCGRTWRRDLQLPLPQRKSKGVAGGDAQPSAVQHRRSSRELRLRPTGARAPRPGPTSRLRPSGDGGVPEAARAQSGTPGPSSAHAPPGGPPGLRRVSARGLRSEGAGGGAVFSETKPARKGVSFPQPRLISPPLVPARGGEGTGTCL